MTNDISLFFENFVLNLSFLVKRWTETALGDHSKTVVHLPEKEITNKKWGPPGGGGGGGGGGDGGLPVPLKYFLIFSCSPSQNLNFLCFLLPKLLLFCCSLRFSICVLLIPWNKWHYSPAPQIPGRASEIVYSLYGTRHASAESDRDLRCPLTKS